LVSAPSPGQGPLLERRSDRELPDIEKNGMRWLRTGPIFLAMLVGSALVIFNYQKSSSSIVASTMYSLRTSPKAREYLGDNIYFGHKMPWIWGDMDPLHGKIDIEFKVKGNANSGTVRFRSFRATRQGVFVTTEWSLEMDNGEKLDLLDGTDPFEKIITEEDEPRTPGRGLYALDLEKKE